MLFKIFWLFTKVALFSWGGGPASLALMQRLTTEAGWVTSAEFADFVALGNALPGPIAPQVSATIGYKLAGVPGAVAGVTGTVLPATLLMLLMVVFFFRVKDSAAVRAMLKAVRPVVVGLLLWTAYDMAGAVLQAKKIGWSAALVGGWDKLVLALVAFALLSFTRVNPLVVVLAGAAFGFIVYR